jgi:site-specific recombinase XerD
VKIRVVCGKSRRERLVPLGAHALKALRHYIGMHDQQLPAAAGQAASIRSQRPIRDVDVRASLSSKQLNQIFTADSLQRTNCSSANRDKGVSSPHRLRSRRHQS